MKEMVDCDVGGVQQHVISASSVVLALLYCTDFFHLRCCGFFAFFLKNVNHLGV
jgi:hypothetical protein